tara:strand:- start:38 stop:511 length:474 start_codon:yes stop_codon:yes gene_type:complete
MKKQEISTKLLKHLGINPSQIDTEVKSCGKALPTWWTSEVDLAKNHIRSVLPLDISHWAIPIETINKVFNLYTLEGSWRDTTRQLGNCSYRDTHIRINLGYRYHKSDSARQKQMYKTLVHEYVHAILYEHYGQSQNHNHRFKFYLRLLSGETYREGR